MQKKLKAHRGDRALPEAERNPNDFINLRPAEDEERIDYERLCRTEDLKVWS